MTNLLKVAILGFLLSSALRFIQFEIALWPYVLNPSQLANASTAARTEIFQFYKICLGGNPMVAKAAPFLAQVLAFLFLGKVILNQHRYFKLISDHGTFYFY